MRILGRSVVVLLLVAIAHVAHAQDFDQAERHFSAAQKAFASAHYKKSATEFQAAYEITRDPLLLYNVAESWQKSGDGHKAVASYHAYLKLLPNATDKKEVQSRIAMIEGQSFQIPDQSSDQPAVVTPPPMPPPVTTPVVESPPPAIAPPVVATVAPDAAVSEPTRDRSGPQVPGGGKMTNLRLAAWLTSAGAIAFVTAGAIFALAADSRANEINRRFGYVDPVTGQPNAFTAAEAADYKSLRSDGRLYNGLGIGFFSAAGASAVAAVSLFVADHYKEKRSQHMALLPMIAPVFGSGQSGVSAGWKF